MTPESRCVAVYADQELHAPHLRFADEAYALGGTQPADTYLAIGKMIEVARKSGADAVHPGYGFLAENADFAEAVDGGRTDLDRSAGQGDPRPGRQDRGPAAGGARSAHLWCPACGQPANDVSDIRSFAADHGFPLLIKAAFGGGGRGMKVVRGPSELDQEYESAVRESTAAFGRGECFVERYLENARHLETQCLADRNGRVVVLSTRDCSLQRRNQKLIEEAPAPFLTADQVDRLYGASKAILAEAGYVNAGTCEFLLAPDGTLSFNEVNTRLQVEHPVTELVTGIDVVQEQLRIAAGGLIDYDDPAIVGHAIEFRVNGEDPAAGFLPSPGRLQRVAGPVRARRAMGRSLRGRAMNFPPNSTPCSASWSSTDAIGARRSPTLVVPSPSSGVDGIATVLPMDRLVVEHPDFVSEPFRVHTHWIETVLAGDLDGLPPFVDHSESEPLGRRRRLTVEVDGRRAEVTLPEDFANFGGSGPPAAAAQASPGAPRHPRWDDRCRDQPHAGKGGQGEGGRWGPASTEERR